ncbi:MAG: hypothetical protein LBF64_06175 [Oscillospiraceae bacterium]|nr:hypothetical protein [Oscillospiraceae bacterium]
MSAVRTAIESLYAGRCTIITRQKQFDPVTKRTEFIETVLTEDQPCRLSYKSTSATDTADHTAAIRQSAVLFIGPDVAAPAGSKFVVTQHGRTLAFQRSGQPAAYTNHQEIPLVPFERWA